MAQIIASTYEIIERIGSGGGGVVYLANHLRLGKKVVLKADKRTITTSPEVLRREVDALKGLSHTYIPQVYDFVVENGIVYTVMDYIEGESLDKPLKRGDKFDQPQIIKWAIQLLEALSYLHNKRILHSDIKPANVMLTPQGDICLIDFNIALALGEEGAVRVGYSRGYASPEHYGTDIEPRQTAEMTVKMGNTGIPEWQMKTVLMGHTVDDYQSGSSSYRKTILLDVRSDIYSLGATLYHILTGKRPNNQAEDVAPISNEDASPQIAAIIAKAMNPNPDLRYQTAEEMLWAFEHLHENDPRTKRLRRSKRIAAAALTAMFLAGGAMAFVGLKQMERTQNAYALAEYSADALRNGDAASAVKLALEALPEQRGPLDPPYTAQAQLALSNALGAYDLSDGYKAYRTIELESEPLKIAVSEDGSVTAAMTLGKVTLQNTGTDEPPLVLPAEPSAMSDLVFGKDNILFYAGDSGISAYDAAAARTIWTGKRATSIALSADGATVAALYKDEAFATVYDAKTGNIKTTVDFNGNRQGLPTNDTFADPQDNLFAISGDGHWLAVSFANGALWVYDLHNADNSVEIYDSSNYTHFEGGFCGDQFAFVSTKTNDSVFAVIDLEQMEQLGAFEGTSPFHTYTDEHGIYVATDNTLVRLNPNTGEQTETAYTEQPITAAVIGQPYTLVTTSDGAYSFFDQKANQIGTYQNDISCDFAVVAGQYAVIASMDSPVLRVLKLENHENRQLFSYENGYPHDEARISADGKTAMLFRYDLFRIYDKSGIVLAETVLPDSANIYDQQFRREDNCLEVIYYDGTVRKYDAASGKLLSEERGEKPDKTLYEEFFTDKWKITSPLHGTPAVYEKNSEKLIRELEPDSYLTYVTQVGDYVITEYITAQGERFGLLLNEKCETLAKFPNLCDVLPDGTLVFDDQRGNLRTSSIYPLEELLALAKSK